MLTKDNIKAAIESGERRDQYNLGFEKTGLPENLRGLANTLVHIHGSGQILRKKDNTFELRIPDPELLAADGDKELNSKHLYVNLSKAHEGRTNAARCVKDGRIYHIESLLSMLPLEERLPNIKKSIKRRVSYVDYTRFLDKDENGNLIPAGPGEVVPLTDLPEDHPAIHYIRARDFTPKQLVEQFSAAFCIKENPRLKYAALPGGFCRTPQGRIIFYVEQLGAKRGWQARQLELDKDGYRYLWHPYKNEWVAVAKLDNSNKPTILPEYDGRVCGKGTNVVLNNKYIIGLGVDKTNMLMGFDAALDWAEYTSNETIGIVEGVFDAARLGPPFVSIMGMSMSSNQGALVKNFFRRAILVPDNDTDSSKREKFLADAKDVLSGLEIIESTLPAGIKDAGDLSVEETGELRKKWNLK